MSPRALEPADYPFFDYSRFTFSLGIEVAGSIWLSGSTAARSVDRKMIVTGDLLEQARVIHDKMRATLAAASRDLADITRITRYVTPAAFSQLPALDVEQSNLLAKNALVTTVPVRSLLRPEALIEIEAVIENSENKEVVYFSSLMDTDLTSAWDEVESLLQAQGLGRSNIVRAMEVLTPAIASGRRPRKSAATLSVVAPALIGGAGVQIDVVASRSARSRTVFAFAEADPSQDGVVKQCREIYLRLQHQLKGKGAELSSIVKTTEFIVPAALSDYRGTADVRREIFSKPFPAATGVICDELREKGALIAVEAIAVLEAG